MNCPKCKKQIDNDSRFCEHCGAKVKESKKGLWVVLGVIVFFISIGMGGMNVYKEQQESSYIELTSQEYVDLGLPSGTLWATENETKQGEDVSYYTYGEAVAIFGNKLPTREQFEELRTQCTFAMRGSDYCITGPNGNFINLPMEGSRYGYWYNKSSSNTMYGLYFCSGTKELGDNYTNYGFSVRLVQN